MSTVLSTFYLLVRSGLLVSLTLIKWIVIYSAILLGTNKWHLGRNCSASSGAQGLTIY